MFTYIQGYDMSIGRRVLQSGLKSRLGALFALMLAVLLFLLLPSVALAQSASLTTTVNNDRSVDLNLSNGPSNWWFRINSWGTCTAASGTTFSNIRGYAAGTHTVSAYSDSSCGTQIASSSFTIPTASLSAVVNNDRSVDLTLTGGPSNWWFRIGSGTCTAATGTTFSNIQGYKAGTHSVNAYPDSGCGYHIASSSFTITSGLPPAAPAQITVERVCDHKFLVRWTSSPGATGYDLNFSVNNRKSWKRASTNGKSTVWGAYAWNKNKTYWLAVRARNAGGESGWTNSAAAPPPPCEVGNLRAVTSTTDGIAGGSITTTWDAAKRANAYNVNYRAAGGEWQRIQSGVSATTHTGTVSGTGGYTVAVQSTGGNRMSQWRNTDVRWLTADGITASGATLTLAGHSGDWYVKKTSPTAGTCSSAIGGNTHNLSALTSDTAHTFIAYSDSSCANAIGSATFTTLAGVVSVSNMSETPDNIGVGILATRTNANAFTTGGHSSGYTLDRVVIKFRAKIGAPGVFTAAIHEVSGGNPAASATYTLSGDSTPTTAGDYTYTCTGTCRLDKDTTYFLVLSGTGTHYSVGHYQWDTTASASETNTPSGAGWSIANRTKYDDGNGWVDEAQIFSGMFEVIASKNPTITLSASGVTASGATLTISRHSAQWWYKADKGPHATCQGPVAANTSSETLTGLSPIETYTYSAYGASGCADANLLATAAAFTTGGVSVSNLSETSDGGGLGVHANDLEANAFTTGDHSGGYTLDRVVIKFRDSVNSAPGVFTATIHEVSGGSPAAAATYTLSGDDTPTTAGDYTYTCSGTCSLDKQTTYFLVLTGTGTSYSTGTYVVDATGSDSETNTPSNAGWSIANRAKYKRGNTWQDETLDTAVMFEVIANTK